MNATKQTRVMLTALSITAFLSLLLSLPKTAQAVIKKESDEFQASHHAEATKILGSLDNVLAQ
jgi:hypothetical protein